MPLAQYPCGVAERGQPVVNLHRPSFGLAPARELSSRPRSEATEPPPRKCGGKRREARFAPGLPSGLARRYLVVLLDLGEGVAEVAADALDAGRDRAQVGHRAARSATLNLSGIV